MRFKFWTSLLIVIIFSVGILAYEDEHANRQTDGQIVSSNSRELRSQANKTQFLELKQNVKSIRTARNVVTKNPNRKLFSSTFRNGNQSDFQFECADQPFCSSLSNSTVSSSTHRNSKLVTLVCLNANWRNRCPVMCGICDDTTEDAMNAFYCRDSTECRIGKLSLDYVNEEEECLELDVRKKCPKTCDACTGSVSTINPLRISSNEDYVPCRDEDSRCENITSEDCKITNSSCPQSCKTCVSNRTELCQIPDSKWCRDMVINCTSRFYRNNCPHTCQLCDVDACVDLPQYCRNLSPKNCSVYQRIYCKRSCGTCPKCGGFLEINANIYNSNINRFGSYLSRLYTQRQILEWPCKERCPYHLNLNATRCEWHINTLSGTTLYIRLTESSAKALGNLNNNSCGNDSSLSFTIEQKSWYESVPKNATKKLSLCNYGSSMLTFASAQIKIVLESKLHFIATSPFQLEYGIYGCGGYISYDYEYTNYNNDRYKLACTWILAQKTDYITTVSFVIPYDRYRDNCSGSKYNRFFYVLRDGYYANSRSIASACYSYDEQSIPKSSYNNALRVELQMSSMVSSDYTFGWKVRYIRTASYHLTIPPPLRRYSASSVAGCGADIHVNDSTSSNSHYRNTIRFPLYDETSSVYGYSSNLHNLNCTWIIRNPKPMRGTLMIKVVQLNLESSEGCTYDHISISETLTTSPSHGLMHLMAKLCGTRISNSTFFSLGERLVVTFRSDSTISSVGFTLNYRWSNCGGVLDAAIGINYTLTSPNYPGFYPANTNCIWIINATSSDTRIRLVVQDIFLESTNYNSFLGSTRSSCPNDHLTIKNGKLYTSPMLMQTCTEFTRNSGVYENESPANQRLYTYLSEDRYMRVEFYSDGYTQYRGFRLTYSLIDDSSDEFVDNCYDITPSYCSMATNNGIHYQCSMLSFRRNCRKTCNLCDRDSDSDINNDYIIHFRNYSMPIGISDDKNCSKATPLNVTSPLGNYTLYMITSPGFNDTHSKYYHNSYCNWNIRNLNPYNTSVFFKFTFLDLERGSMCHFDYLLFQEDLYLKGELEEITRYCGTLIAQNVTSFATPANNIKVTFRSDSSLSNHGFSLEYGFINCGGLIDEDHGNGIITSPNYPHNYLPNLDCTWVIKSKNASTKVVVTILDVSLETHQDCHHDYLTIRSNISYNSSVANTFCDNNYNANGTSFKQVADGYGIRVEFHSDASISGNGFQLSYKFTTVRVCKDNKYKCNAKGTKQCVKETYRQMCPETCGVCNDQLSTIPSYQQNFEKDLLSVTTDYKVKTVTATKDQKPHTLPADNGNKPDSKIHHMSIESKPVKKSLHSLLAIVLSTIALVLVLLFVGYIGYKKYQNMREAKAMSGASLGLSTYKELNYRNIHSEETDELFPCNNQNFN